MRTNHRCYTWNSVLSRSIEMSDTSTTRLALTLLLSGCLFASTEAQVVSRPPSPRTESTEQSKSTAASETSTVNGPATQRAPQVGRSDTESALHTVTIGRNAYALIPVSDLAALTKETRGSGDTGQTWLESLVALVKYIAWPGAAIFLVLRLLRAPQIELLLTKLSQRTTQISVFGLEIKLSDGAKATLEDIQKLIAQVPDTHQDWVENSHLEARFQHVVSHLRFYLCEANSDFPIPLPLAQFRELRFTLHVPDVLLTHSVRQLVNYVGSDRGRAGRLFSTRRGIVGLAWRLEQSRYETRVYTEDELVEKWGMTRSEAQDTTGQRGLLLVFVLKDARGLPLAALYAD